MIRTAGLAAALAALLTAGAAGAQAPRLLTPDDINAFKTVSDPRVSPDGQWVAYVVQQADLKEDKQLGHLWMTSWDGKRTVQLTSRAKEQESTPRWSPDGRWLAFLSGRGDEHEHDQLWVLDRLGGEARKVTEVKGSVLDFDWAPGGERLALIVQDPDPQDDQPDEAGKVDKDKTKPPIVIDRYRFKEDITGYLGKQRARLHLLTLATGKLERITSGEFDEGQPSWSPDGRLLAFVSIRDAEPDRSDDWNVYVVEPRAGAQPRALTTSPGGDNDPYWESPLAWSPDGRAIAFIQGPPPKQLAYGIRRLALAPVAGGPVRVLTPDLDRNVDKPVWAPDGRSLEVIVETEGAQELVRVSAADGKRAPVLGGRRVIGGHDSAAGREAVLVSDLRAPPEVFALEKGRLRPLSRQNAALLASVRLADIQEIRFPSRDGVEIQGFLITPPGYQPGRPYPTILRIHGGPTSQYAAEFLPEWQILAAQGYVIVAANPRGSTGRGEAFASAIYAAWGDKDAQDVLAAVDWAVGRGIADPNRLGIGGWSYGGMMTNYVIAQDARFKAAIAGAGIGNILAGYGTDQYVRDYDVELGPPWANLDAWLKVSAPFFHADRIKTPTLFLVGQEDWNVPLIGSEQMYQALRTQGVETRLVIYPGQHHRITKPSYLRDRLRRYVDWYGKHLKPAA
ncbi:MAG TPA: S9 family peptidase [Caulobacteraceae bacterium]|jgi:dipeptidyl aminopeptidase/acylaminoacyl peptidase